jgi:hypothetical protein
MAGYVHDIASVHENQDSAVLLRPAQAALLAFAQRDLNLTAPLGSIGQAFEGFIYENCVDTLSGHGLLDPFSYSAKKNSAVFAELLVQTNLCK